jgi:hypothetical protein
VATAAGHVAVAVRMINIQQLCNMYSQLKGLWDFVSYHTNSKLMHMVCLEFPKTLLLGKKIGIMIASRINNPNAKWSRAVGGLRIF